MACTTLDGRPLAVTSSTYKTVQVWDLVNAAVSKQVAAGHTADIAAVACSIVDGQPMAVTASDDATVRVWDLTTNAELAVFDYAGYMRGALCIGPAQEIVIGTGWDLAVIDRRPSR